MTRRSKSLVSKRDSVGYMLLEQLHLRPSYKSEQAISSHAHRLVSRALSLPKDERVVPYSQSARCSLFVKVRCAASVYCSTVGRQGEDR